MNNIRNLACGWAIYVAELTFGLFVSDNREIYFNVPEARLKFLILHISHIILSLIRLALISTTAFRKSDNMLG